MTINASDLGIKASAAAPDDTKTSDVVQTWLKEISDALKREKDWRKDARRVVDLYEGEKKVENQYNILYSNTETMLPALYNSTPRPLVQRRFKDEDPLGKMASTAGQRTLEYLADNGDPSYTDFDDLMKSAVLEALVPGRGLTRFKYDANIETVQKELQAEEAETAEVADDDETSTIPSEGSIPQDRVTYETVCGEEIPWDRFLHGNAKKWKDVPWCSIEHFMTREELERNFGAIGKDIPVVEMSESSYSSSEDRDSGPREELKGVKVAQVYEVWDKEERKVLFLSPQYKKGLIKEVSDPLELTGFYPWPRPLSFVAKISTLVPVTLYTMYEEQAKELNTVTVRINKITHALKVRGMYDSTLEGIGKVLEADDNMLIPAENVAAMLAQGNALEKAIWLMPIDKLVAVLQQLYLNRQQIKTVIYEITGIADIMRGSSAASETLGAQKIKNQWGTLRLKRTQKEVQRYCRDCLRIMLEIAVAKLSAKTLQGMTGLPYPLQGQQDQMKQQVAGVQQQYQMVAQHAQMTGQQPPPPPQIPPEVQKALSMPTWETLQKLLQDDTSRSYRIDIETNSTVDTEATEDKQDITELLTGISQFLNGVGPLVQSGTLPFTVAQSMMLAVVRRYRFGTELEDSLKEMQDPRQQQGQNPEEVKKQQVELQKQGEQLKQEQQKLTEQKAEIESKLKEQVMQLDMDRKQFAMEQSFAQREMEMKKQFVMKEIDMHQQVSANDIKAASTSAGQQLDAKAQQVKQAQQAPKPQPKKA